MFMAARRSQEALGISAQHSRTFAMPYKTLTNSLQNIWAAVGQGIQGCPSWCFAAMLKKALYISTYIWRVRKGQGHAFWSLFMTIALAF